MKEFYRKATPQELQFYQQVLYPLQDAVFETVATYGRKLYLTGGTALSRFHFHHRLSEDLDFFTTTEDLKELANDLSARLNAKGHLVEIERLEVYFARIFIVKETFSLKIEFAREFNMLGPLLKTDKKIFTNNLDDLGANKITAFEDRANIKDIIDLYYITQKIPLEKLFELADAKRVPVAYENLLTINVSGIAGNALITRNLPAETLLDFVNALKQKTEAEIKKKEELAIENMQQVVTKLLWDFPRERRYVNKYSLPVLKRRSLHLKLPERIALQKITTRFQSDLKNKAPALMEQ